MASGTLPDDGELRIGSVSLPEGRQIVSGAGLAIPVLWATTNRVPDPGLVWSALSQASEATGLIPVLLATLDELGRPWGNDELNDPEDIRELDRIDAGQLLAELWDDELPLEEEDDDRSRAMRVPFGRQFPGLAPAENEQLAPPELHQLLAELPPARIGLASASRAADVLPLIGWTGTANWAGLASWHGTALAAAVILRSWEDRFGATLLQVGFDEIRLLAIRPPRSARTAQLLAAEQYAFCSECAGQGLRDIAAISEHLMQENIWTFWWD